MLATLVIFLREGVEASMIVAILLAYLTIRSYDGSRVQTIFETATYLVAAAVLTYMTFWMRDHARSLSSELRKRTDAALDGRARWGLGLLAFQAVGREGLETVVFTLAIVFSTSAASAMGGAAIGLAGALGIAFVIYRLGHRLNLGRFFTVIGVLLMAFAAGLLANVVENLQQLGWLPMLTGPLWHSGRILSEDSSFGDVLHSFFGYSDAPTILQILVYFGYLAIVIIAYLGLASRLRRSRDGSKPAQQPQPPAASQPASSGGTAPPAGQAPVGAQAASYRPSGGSGGAASRYQPSRARATPTGTRLPGQAAPAGTDPRPGNVRRRDPAGTGPVPSPARPPGTRQPPGAAGSRVRRRW